MTQEIQKKKRNFAISYIKGIAILFIMAIHLLDWSGTGDVGRIWKQILYTGVVFFMATAGSVVWIAYGKHEDLRRPTKRLLQRGLELIGLYYLYNIIKFFIFDFRTENFYEGYVQKGVFNWHGLLTLKAYAVPIPILLTIGMLIMLSPLFLWVLKKVKGGVWYLFSLFVLLCLVNYIVPLPQNALTDFLYARGNNITFSFLPWSTAFLLGLLVAYWGFEKRKHIFFPLFLFLLPFTFWFTTVKGWSWYIDYSLHPLQPQAIVTSFALMFAFIYIFEWIEKFSAKKGVHFSLATLRVLGDSSLSVYLLHWVVIDLTLWIFSSTPWVVRITGILFLILFIFFKRKMVKQYVEEYI